MRVDTQPELSCAPASDMRISSQDAINGKLRERDS
jgi:hypothetical protein